MNFGELALMGLVQGVTEFFPISSDGHLWLLQYAFGLEPDLGLVILLHASSLAAVVLFFWKDLKILAHQGLLIFKKPSENGVLAWKLILATLLTAVIGFPIEQLMEAQEFTLSFVAWCLIFTGFVLFLSHGIRLHHHQELTWKKTIVLGLVQGIAPLPGVSRSGVTISALLMMGIPPKKAAKISFLLSIPTISGAIVFGLGKGMGTAFLSLPAFWGASLICFGAAWGAIALVIDRLREIWLLWAWYCFILGSVLLWLGTL